MTDIGDGIDNEIDSTIEAAGAEPGDGLLDESEHSAAPATGDAGVAGAAAAATPATKRRRPDRGLLIASAVIAGGLALIVWGMLSAITGDDGIDRPPEIQGLSPVENAVQVLQQESVTVDLQFGYEAVLIIDGIELPTTDISEIETAPGQQRVIPPTATYDPGNAVITFSPSENALITEFTQGRHEARVVYWKIEEGRQSALSYTWTFTVV